MLEGAPEIFLPQTSVKINVGELKVAPEIKIKLANHNNHGLQAALMCADDKFDISTVGKIGLENRLKGNVKGMFGWKKLGEVSRNERLGASEKQNLAEWKTNMVKWFGEYETKMPGAYKLYREVIGNMLNLPMENQLDTTNMEQLAIEVRNPSDGLANFIEAALMVPNIDTPGVLDEIGNLAEALFGGEISAEIVCQAIALKRDVVKNANNLSPLVENLFAEGKLAVGIFTRSQNQDAAHVLGGINELTKVKLNQTSAVIKKIGAENVTPGAVRVLNQTGEKMDFEIYHQQVAGKDALTIKPMNTNSEMKVIWDNGSVHGVTSEFGGMVISMKDRFYLDGSFYIYNGDGRLLKITDEGEITKLNMFLQRESSVKK